MPGLLTVSETARLSVLERVIRRGQRKFIEVGRALAEIRDSRLYQYGHRTFEEYCREKWGWNRAYAGKIIEAAEVVGGLPENVSHGIQNERQARELARVEPERRAQVIEVAASVASAEERPMAARDIREAAAPEPREHHEPTSEAVTRSRFAVQIEEMVQAARELPIGELWALKVEWESAAQRLRRPAPTEPEETATASSRRRIEQLLTDWKRMTPEERGRLLLGMACQRQIQVKVLGKTTLYRWVKDMEAQR